MKKAFTTLAIAALLFAGVGLAGCSSTKCCDGNPPCAGCLDKPACPGCTGGAKCAKCEKKAKGCADCEAGTCTTCPKK